MGRWAVASTRVFNTTLDVWPGSLQPGPLQPGPLQPGPLQPGQQTMTMAMANGSASADRRVDETLRAACFGTRAAHPGMAAAAGRRELRGQP
eukprot:352917-Chlamydomonas_euryale.AAC.7